MRFKLPKHWGWFALGLTVFVVIAADVTTAMFDAGYFSVSDTLVTLRGTLTNWAKLNTNQVAGNNVVWTNDPAGTATLVPGITNVQVPRLSVTGTNALVTTNGIVNLTLTANRLTGNNGTNLETSVTVTGPIRGDMSAVTSSDLNALAAEPVSTISTNYTVVQTNNGSFFIVNSATNVTWTFNDGGTNGFSITIKNLGAGSVILTNNAGKTFDGAASITIPSSTISHWIGDGSNYRGGRNGPKNLVGGNQIFASPSDGSTGLMVPRAHVAGDFPANVIADSNLVSGVIGTNKLMKTRTGVYRHIYVDAGAMVPPTTSPATAATNAGTFTSDAWTFSTTATNYMLFKLVPPKQWDLSSLKIQAQWTCTGTNSTADTNIVWGVAAADVANGGNLTNAYASMAGTEVYCTNGIGTNSFMLFQHLSPALTVGGTPAIGDMVWFRIAGYGGNGSWTETNTASVQLLGVTLQYLESTNEASAW